MLLSILSNNLNRISLYSVFFSLIISYTSFSQTITNYGQWRNLSTVSKSIYVSGMVDYILSISCKNCVETIGTRALKQCLTEFQINNSEISIMIDNFYLLKENWKYNPQIALQHQLINGFCKPYLD